MKYLVKQKYICEDIWIIEANSKAEAENYNNKPINDDNMSTRVIRTFNAKAIKSQES
jgi:hypothetical protein